MSQFYQLQYPVDQTDIDGVSVCGVQDVDGVAVLNPNSPYYQNGMIVFDSSGFSVIRQIILNITAAEEDTRLVINGYSNGILISEEVIIAADGIIAKSLNYFSTIISITFLDPAVGFFAASVIDGGFIGSILMNSSSSSITNYLVTMQAETIQQGLNAQVNLLVSCNTANGQPWLNYLNSLTDLGPILPVSLTEAGDMEFPSYNINGFGLGKVMCFRVIFNNPMLPAETITIQFLQNGI